MRSRACGSHSSGWALRSARTSDWSCRDRRRPPRPHRRSGGRARRARRPRRARRRPAVGIGAVGDRGVGGGAPETRARTAPGHRCLRRSRPSTGRTARGLDGADWLRPAPPYAWSVHELVAHLTLIEEYTVRQFGLADVSPAAVGDEAGRGPPDARSERDRRDGGRRAALTVSRWVGATRTILDHLRSGAFDPTRLVPLHAWPFDATTALVARAFEIWTHADDIRRAVGREPDVPSPEELRTMSSTSVRGLPTLHALAGGGVLPPTRVVLTGSGGGTFDLVATSTTAVVERQLIVADVVDYCRLVARRLAPDDLAGTRDGDTRVLTELLRAAQAFAI
ncbi:MAG: maleylpyruvate isomerase N-terminal domain-containing protein [Ilumatobacteraceae bacterium]